MIRLLFVCSLLLGLAACTLFGDDPFGPRRLAPPVIEEDALAGCEAIESAISAELRYIQFCERRSDCGLPLTGTSCGCTRDLVARADADTARFYRLLDRVRENQCDAGFFSTCDCPAVNGFACVENQCVWNYTSDE